MLSETIARVVRKSDSELKRNRNVTTGQQKYYFATPLKQNKTKFQNDDYLRKKYLE